MAPAWTRSALVARVPQATDSPRDAERGGRHPDRVLKTGPGQARRGSAGLPAAADLSETFTRVAQELHSQYVLGFSPEAMDGRIHKLEVRVKKAGMNARARKTYVAASAGTK